MFNTTPTQTLLAEVRNALTQDDIVTEKQRVQLIMLGREIYFHPSFADMNYVESKTDFVQLDKQRRATYSILTQMLKTYRLSVIEMNLNDYVDNITIVLMSESVNK